MILVVEPCADRIRYYFQCPGCNETHVFAVPGWSFDGDMERPTVNPSILVTSGHYADKHKPGDSCWCTFNAERPNDPAPFKCLRCHSFIRNGQIQFLSDCSHALAGQTIDMVAIAPARQERPDAGD